MSGGWSLGEYPLEDLFAMAANVAQGGFDFYARLIARSSNPEEIRELKRLRDEEAKHRSFFLEQLRSRGLTPKGPVSPGLKALLDLEFIEPVSKAYATGAASDKSRVLAFAVSLEEKTIAFYRALRVSCSVPGQHAELDRIIAEEETHKLRLEALWEHRSAEDVSLSPA
jgi:rubrerythrin